RELFTTLSAPVMTRLRQPQRQVLDTLVDAGVARSRSEALAWCVRLVGEHAEDWLAELGQGVGEGGGRGPRGPGLWPPGRAAGHGWPPPGRWARLGSGRERGAEQSGTAR